MVRRARVGGSGLSGQCLVDSITKRPAGILNVLCAFGLARRVVSVARRQQSQESQQEIGVTLGEDQTGLAV